MIFSVIIGAETVDPKPSISLLIGGITQAMALLLPYCEIAIAVSEMFAIVEFMLPFMMMCTM